MLIDVSATAPRFSVRDEMRSKTILVTGFTGFLGKVAVAMGLERLPDTHFVLLTRKQRGASAAQRIERDLLRSPVFRALRERGQVEAEAWISKHLSVLEGDIKSPFFGLSEPQFVQLSASIDGMMHFAGSTDFNPDPSEALAVNTLGAVRAFELSVRAASFGKKLPFLHVSTCFVAGENDGRVEEELVYGTSPLGIEFDPQAELRVFESLCENIAAETDSETRKLRLKTAVHRANSLGWPNIYTYSKGLAEHLLVARAKQANIDAPILLRPSIVECAQAFPFAGWNEGVNTSAPLVWLVGSAHRSLPIRAAARFDVIPVDDVAKSCLHVMARALAGSARRVYHVASSSTKPLTFQRAVDLTSLVRKLEHQQSESVFDRAVLARLDSYVTDTPFSDEVVLPAARKFLRSLSDLSSKVKLSRLSEAREFQSVAEPIDKFFRKGSRVLGQTARTIAQVEQLLEMYQPFVFDHDYEFRTDHIRKDTLALDLEEQDLFGFDLSNFDWRHYWMNVQIPGLDKWSLPALHGQRIEHDDPPFSTFAIREFDLDRMRVAPEASSERFPREVMEVGK